MIPQGSSPSAKGRRTNLQHIYAASRKPQAGASRIAVGPPRDRVAGSGRGARWLRDRVARSGRSVRWLRDRVAATRGRTRSREAQQRAPSERPQRAPGRAPDAWHAAGERERGPNRRPNARPLQTRPNARLSRPRPNVRPQHAASPDAPRPAAFRFRAHAHRSAPSPSKLAHEKPPSLAGFHGLRSLNPAGRALAKEQCNSLRP